MGERSVVEDVLRRPSASGGLDHFVPCEIGPVLISAASTMGKVRVLRTPTAVQARATCLREIAEHHIPAGECTTAWRQSRVQAVRRLTDEPHGAGATRHPPTVASVRRPLRQNLRQVGSAPRWASVPRGMIPGHGSVWPLDHHD